MNGSVVFLALWLLTMGAEGEVFDSMEDLAHSYELEVRFISQTKIYLAEKRRRVDLLRSDYKKLQIPTVEICGGSQEVNHPIEAFHTITRVAHGWKQLLRQLGQFEAYLELRQTIQTSNMSNITTADLDGGYRALLRLQEVYHMKAGNLFNGRLLGTRAVAPTTMTLDDCLDMALLAMKQGLYSISIEWLHLAEGMAPDHTATKRLGEMKKAATRGRDIVAAIDDDDGDTKLQPLMGQGVRGVSFYFTGPSSYAKEVEGRRQSVSLTTTRLPIPYKIDFWTKYEALCRGEQIVHTRTAQCHYKETSVPYYRYREEVLSESPHMSIIYNFMTDKEAEYLRQDARSKLRKAKVRDLEYTGSRVARVAWLASKSSHVSSTLSARITSLTGLNAETYAEKLQVSAYGLSGHYELHHDFDQARFLDAKTEGIYMGDRLATFMIYMSDVEAGGATVFPLLDISIRPAKNAGIFWFNLDERGRPMVSTLHAGCPVILGSKWVANKWIHQHGQIHHNPCKLKSR